MKITDIITSKHTESIDIQYNSNVSVDRVKELTMNNINANKKRKSFKRVLCGIVCVAVVSTMGIGVYATSPEVKEFVDSIFQRNKQDVDNQYSMEQQTLMNDNLHISDVQGIDTFESVEVSLNAILNRGDSAEGIFTVKFDDLKSLIGDSDKYILYFDEYSISPVDDAPNLSSYSVGDIYVEDLESGTCRYYMNVDDIKNGLGEDKIEAISPTDNYRVSLNRIRIELYDNDFNLIDTKYVEGSYSVNFSFGEPAPVESVPVDKNVTWNFKCNPEECVYPAGNYDFHVSSVEYNSLKININLDYLLNDVTSNAVINSDGFNKNDYIQLSAIFYSVEVMQLFYGDGQRDTCPEYEEYCALKLIDNDGNVIIEPYVVEDDFNNKTLTFNFNNPVDFENIKAIEFCGEEISIK